MIVARSVRADRGRRGVEVDRLVGVEVGQQVHVRRAQAVGIVDHHDRAQLGQLVADLEQPLQELDVLDHRDPRPAVPGQLGDLLGR
jgi:hypothetical protein